jgi:hypothetical protein
VNYAWPSGDLLFLLGSKFLAGISSASSLIMTPMALAKTTLDSGRAENFHMCRFYVDFCVSLSDFIGEGGKGKYVVRRKALCTAP